MNPKEFFYNVVELRKAQRAYARSKGLDREALQTANHYERIIDQEIKRVQIQLYEQNNPRLDFSGID